MFSRKVTVTFVEQGSGTVLREAEMDPEQLPESFLHETTLQLADQEWSVAMADPPLRAEYTRSRRLIVTLTRITRTELGSREILFSLATINDALPDESGNADGREPVLHEDDWRQTEFVHVRHAGLVEDEFQAIRNIHGQHRRRIGFDKVHVRSRVPEPMAGASVELDALTTLELEQPRPLRLERHGYRVHGGFAHALSQGQILYGVARDSWVKVLGLHGTGEMPLTTVALLEAFARSHDLLLVDWCRCGVGAPGAGSFQDIVAGLV